MRRGYRNRWDYDQSPQGDGIVTVCKDGKRVQYANLQALRDRDKEPSTLKLLRKYGW